MRNNGENLIWWLYKSKDVYIMRINNGRIVVPFSKTYRHARTQKDRKKKNNLKFVGQ